MAVAKSIEAQVRGLKQASGNTNDAISLIQTAEGSMNETSNILSRLKELAVQSASDTLGDKKREMLNLEFEQLISEVDRVANNTKYNGVNLLNGEGNDLYRFQVGPNSDESNVIEFDTTEIDATSSTLGVEGTGILDRDEALDSIEMVTRQSLY